MGDVTKTLYFREDNNKCGLDFPLGKAKNFVVLSELDKCGNNSLDLKEIQKKCLIMVKLEIKNFLVIT